MEQITPEKALEALEALTNDPILGNLNPYQGMNVDEVMQELNRQREQEIEETRAAEQEAARIAEEQEEDGASVAKQNRMMRVSSLNEKTSEGVPERSPEIQPEGVPPEPKSRRRSGCGSSICSARPGKTHRNRKGPRQRRGGYKRRNKTQRRMKKRQTTKRLKTKRRLTKRRMTKRLKTKRRTSR